MGRQANAHALPSGVFRSEPPLGEQSAGSLERRPSSLKLYRPFSNFH